MNPILYVLMRDDLASLNSGKAMAQAVHAGNAVETHFETQMQVASTGSDTDEKTKAAELSSAFYEWKHQTSQGFGTTIVLCGSMAKIKTDIEWLQRNDFLASVVHDPTYPLQDGSVTHLIPLDTCAYVFAPNKDDQYLRMILNSYELHP
jgi:peptidyl-tRNA hydrolase